VTEKFCKIRSKIMLYLLSEVFDVKPTSNKIDSTRTDIVSAAFAAQVSEPAVSPASSRPAVE
jgi:hypothetical protein